MSVESIKALTKRIRLRHGSSEKAAGAAGLTNKGSWSLYENESHADTTLPIYRFLICSNDAEKEALIDIIRDAMDQELSAGCVSTASSLTTETSADLQRTVREARADGVITPREESEIVAKAMEVKAGASNVLKALREVK